MGKWRVILAAIAAIAVAVGGLLVAILDDDPGTVADPAKTYEVVKENVGVIKENLKDDKAVDETLPAPPVAAPGPAVAPVETGLAPMKSVRVAVASSASDEKEDDGSGDEAKA